MINHHLKVKDYETKIFIRTSAIGNGLVRRFLR